MKKSIKNIIFIAIVVVITVFMVATGKLKNNVSTTSGIFRHEDMQRP